MIYGYHNIANTHDISHSVQITIAFVIDISSSMQDDMDNVRLYISKLVEEKQRSGVEAEFIVTTFADGPG